MGLTGLSQLPPSVRVSLAEGEEPLAWQTVDLAWGESRLGRTGPPRAIEGVDLNPLSALASGPVRVDPGLFERWVGGVMLTGHLGSVAAGMAHALQQARSAMWLAVTTDRLALFVQGATTFGQDAAGRKTWDADTTEMWAVPRGTVASARLRPRPLMAGRLVIEFADSSSVALMCGMVVPRAAQRLRDALAAPTNG